jgi:adenosylhomocysteine nucleosidase
MTALIVAALHEEVAHVEGHDVLVTGVGKAVAAAALAQRLAVDRPSVVVNIGTAGAVRAGVSGVVEVDHVTQHDLPYDEVELITGPIVRAYRLSGQRPPEAIHDIAGSAMVLATGDVFVADADRAAQIADSGVHLVDMEGFAYAATCASFGVPFRCVKAVSDSADEAAGLSWLDTIDRCARALADWVASNVTQVRA